MNDLYAFDPSAQARSPPAGICSGTGCHRHICHTVATHFTSRYLVVRKLLKAGIVEAAINV